MEYNTSSTATFSRKFSNIHKSFHSTSIYDGVFTNTSKFGVSSSFSSPVEDYTEIFGGPRESRRSSIPVLDIPALHERKVSANARSSKLDYSAIFGGDSENTASYEELLAKSNNHGSFSKEARAQAYRRSHSEALAKSIGENEVLPKEGIHISYDKVKSFNVSYNKVEPSGENGANGRTHITQLCDVPGYTCLVEETGPSKQAKNERAVTNDTSTTSDADEGLLKDSGTKTLPDQPASSNNKTQTKEGAVGCNSRHTRSMSKNFLFDGYEFGLKTDGMHSPSMVNSNSRFGTSPRRATENFSCVYSPPDFGYEVEENSLAAASAAAVKKAIEIAEARIRLAKELMEKDKEMLHGNVSSKNVIKKERRNGEMAKKLNISSGIKAKEVCDLDNKRQMMEAPGKANSMDDTLLELDTVLRHRQISSSEAGQHTHEQEYESFQEDCQQQELEDVAVVNESNKAALISLELKQGFTMKNIIQSGYEFFARNWMRAADKPSQELMENSKSPVTVEEDLSQKKVENEQPAVEALKEGMQSERRRPDTENHEKKLATEQYNESVEMPTLLHDEGIHQKKLDVYNESALGEDLQTRELEIQMNSMKGVPGLKDNEFEQIDVYKGGEENGSRNMFDGEQARHPSEASSMKEEDAEMQEESFETVLSESEPEGIHFIEVNKEGFVLSYAAADMSTRLHAFQELEELKEFPGGKSSWLYDQGDVEGDNKLREGRINNNINDELKQMEVTDQQDSHECFITERITAEINAETESETRESVDSRVDSIVTEPDDQVILEFEHRSLEVLECDRTNENVHASVNEVEEKEDVGKENISSINFKGNDENSRNIDDNHGLDESYRSDWSNIVQNGLEVEEFQEQLEEIGALGFHVNGIHNSADINEAHRDNQSTEESPMMGNEEMHSWDSSSMSDEEKHQHASVADMHQYYDDTTKSEISINGEEQAGVSINGEKLDDGFADSARCNDDINSEASDQSLFSERVEKPHNLECFNDNRWVDDDDNTNFHIEEDHLSVSSERRGETMGMQLNNLNQSFEHVSFEGKEETLVFHVETNSHQSFEKEETLEFPVETNSCQSFEKDDLYVEASEQFASSERIDKPENLECIDDSKWVHDNNSNFRIEEDGVSPSNERKNETVGLQQETRSSQCFENLLSEGKEETLQFPSIANSRQSFETNDTLKVEDRDNDSSVQKEIKQEKDQDKKIDVSKERERAREMERLAVERAIREARERAFAEARERAAVQKATAEARQRVTAHAREKLGKGSTDVNGRLAEKTSIEAKLRAERAAVERATAEARERALEKAMSEKFSSHDSHNKGSHPSINTQNRDSSDHNEGSDIVKGESAERRKARLERHQRTAERAAKALAEKNMRDIIAQREQAERNRMAETLDADIKRWLGGKQGNLRALLSTLQYILGPDSGWQPVSLTEIITTAAVKKAYRKATLCVHPDKLQQRGATLQQKYVCEKVFDLLKEAWNKFNAEER